MLLLHVILLILVLLPMTKKPSHVKWIDDANNEQQNWIREQLTKRGIPLVDFFSYVKGSNIPQEPRRYLAEQARLLGNYWRSIQSREDKTTITLTTSAASTIRKYCKQRNIAVTTLLDGYAASLKFTPGLLPSGLSSNAKITLLGEIEALSRLNEELLRFFGELEAEENARKAKEDNALTLLAEIEHHLGKLRELASSRQNKGRQIKNSDSLI